MKCRCGGNVDLTHKDKLGRIKDKVTVFNVPVFSCDNCGFRFMSGSDGKRLAARVKEAVCKGLDEIQF